MPLRTLLQPLLHWYWRLGNHLDIRRGHRARHIVICGYPRSGTSLLYIMIAASIEGYRCEEFETLAVERLHRRGNYVTKFPLDILNVEAIRSSNVLSKDVYFLVLVRDVRDLITSRHPQVPDRYFIGYESSLWPQDPEFSRWDYSAPGIGAIHRAIQSCASDPRMKLLKVRYETLVTDTSGIQGGIEQFLSLTFPAKFADYYTRPDRHVYRYSGRYQAKDASLARESAQVDSNRIAKWKSPEHRAVVREQFTRHPELFQILIDDGYEADRKWFAAIEAAPASGTV